MSVRPGTPKHTVLLSLCIDGHRPVPRKRGALKTLNALVSAGLIELRHDIGIGPFFAKLTDDGKAEAEKAHATIRLDPDSVKRRMLDLASRNRMKADDHERICREIAAFGVSEEGIDWFELAEATEQAGNRKHDFRRKYYQGEEMVA